MSSNYNDAENYCKDCDRSIYGKYHDCDINIENNGMYVKGYSKGYEKGYKEATVDSLKMYEKELEEMKKEGNT